MLLSEQSKAITVEKREREQEMAEKNGNGAKVGLCNFKDSSVLSVSIMESVMGESLESGNFSTAFEDDIIP